MKRRETQDEQRIWALQYQHLWYRSKFSVKCFNCVDMVGAKSAGRATSWSGCAVFIETLFTVCFSIKTRCYNSGLVLWILSGYIGSSAAKQVAITPYSECFPTALHCHTLRRLQFYFIPRANPTMAALRFQFCLDPFLSGLSPSKAVAFTCERINERSPTNGPYCTVLQACAQRGVSFGWQSPVALFY
jgi:hypothetical protein